jgi:hypothetical protein
MGGRKAVLHRAGFRAKVPVTGGLGRTWMVNPKQKAD